MYIAFPIIQQNLPKARLNVEIFVAEEIGDEAA
jgi:hypothetical protein